MGTMKQVLAPSDVETRSVDRVPHSERFGKSSDLGNIWFVGNVNLTAMATGVVAMSLGSNLIWTVIAVVLGSLFGTFFMAFHSAQGPQLGIPQLVQSRAQFGYIGAALTVWVFALANYITYNTSDAILSGSAMHEIFGIQPQIGFFIAAAIATIIALYGYSLIHFLNKLLFWPSIVALGAMTLGVYVKGNFPPGAFDLSNFNLASFMTVFVIVAGFQLGWAPYVSDYSRYLPKEESIRATFWATYLASGLSAVWVFALGAIASGPNGTLTPVTAVKVAGDSIFTGLGTVLLMILLLGLLLVMAINAYGGSLTMISMVDSFKKVNPTKAIRLVALLVMGFTVWSIAQFVGEERFNAFYGNALIFLAYIFTPWTAVNLVDYFYVRKGVYVIGEIFNKDGIYGRWGWRGNTAYIVGFLSMVPFFVTTPYVGFIAKIVSDVDYSLFVGLFVSANVYLVLAKGIDREKEAKMAATEGHF